jgi:hypothetical protein
MTLLRVRVEIVDAPGALAALTTAVAGLGIDVAAIDVLEFDGSTVVDELLLRIPEDGPTAPEVEDALRRAGAIDVLSSTETRPTADAAVRAFDLVRDVFAVPADAEAVGRALASCAYADLGALVDLTEAEKFPLGRRALEERVPATGRAAPDAGPLAVPTGWILWVAPQVPHPTRLAVVGRRLNVRFSATEAARLRAFVTLLEMAVRLPAPRSVPAAPW